MKLKAGDILFNPDVRDLKIYVVKVEEDIVSYSWEGCGMNRKYTYKVQIQTIVDKGWRRISKLEKALC